MAGTVAPAGGNEQRKAQPEDSTIKTPDGAINIENVMARIRCGIAEEKKSPDCPKDPLLSQGIDLLRLDRSCATIAERLLFLQHLARSDLQGEPIVSSRPIIGFLIKLAKRINRWWIRKYTDGLFVRQSNINAELVSVLSEMNRQIEHLRAEIERLKKERQNPPEGEK